MVQGVRPWRNGRDLRAYHRGHKALLQKVQLKIDSATRKNDNLNEGQRSSSEQDTQG